MDFVARRRRDADAFWIVGITNAFNLLDNMDGLCWGTTLIAGAFLLAGFVNGGSAGQAAAIYLAALLGATAGFLVYNKYPASIFLGDTGSLFLGLNFAALTLARPEARGKAGLMSVVAAPVLLLLIPIFDTTLVTAARVLFGRRPSQGGRDHSSHRLVAVGLSESRAVTTLWGLAAAGGAISLMLERGHVGIGGIAALCLLAMMIFAVYLGRVDTDDPDEATIATPGDAAGRHFMQARGGGHARSLPDSARLLHGTGSGSRQPSRPTISASCARCRWSSRRSSRFRGRRLPRDVAPLRHDGRRDLRQGRRARDRRGADRDPVLYRFESFSRAVFVIDAALLMLLLSSSRASFRLVAEFILRRSSSGQRCVIYGTGGASLGTIREAFGADTSLKIVGFIDDDPRQRSMRVSGYSVLGDHTQLLGMIERRDIDCVVLNTPVVAVERLQELERRCGAREIALLRLHVHLKPLSAAAS
jgi:UDP-GlcNAc:undecaprenyl-phosphate GlcNAc-1-phosphate transferase